MVKKQKTDGRVFVLQKQSKYDVSAAKYYSKNIIYIADSGERLSPFDTFSLIDLIKHELQHYKFDPYKDFICLTGASVLLSVFLATIMKTYTTVDQFKCLIYDARNSRYQLRLINFGV